MEILHFLLSNYLMHCFLSNVYQITICIETTMVGLLLQTVVEIIPSKGRMASVMGLILFFYDIYITMLSICWSSTHFKLDIY